MVQRVVVPYHPPSGEPVGICRPSVAWPQKVQRFVVPHFSQTPPNHRPENLRSEELPTLRKNVITDISCTYYGGLHGGDHVTASHHLGHDIYDERA